jgi:hypothetical protein
VSAALARLLAASPVATQLGAILGGDGPRSVYRLAGGYLDGVDAGARRARYAAGVRELAARMRDHAARLEAWADRAEGVGE